MSLKVYIACSWSKRAEAAEAQAKFKEAGFDVTSHWIEFETDLTYADMTPDKPEHNDTWTEHAIKDFEDIIRSDVFVILNLDISEGKATEMGFAYGIGIPIILVGERTRNIFYHLPNIFRADTVEAAVEGCKLAGGLEFVGDGADASGADSEA